MNASTKALLKCNQGHGHHDIVRRHILALSSSSNTSACTGTGTGTIIGTSTRLFSKNTKAFTSLSSSHRMNSSATASTIAPSIDTVTSKTLSFSVPSYSHLYTHSYTSTHSLSHSLSHGHRHLSSSASPARKGCGCGSKTETSSANTNANVDANTNANANANASNVKEVPVVHVHQVSSAPPSKPTIQVTKTKTETVAATASPSSPFAAPVFTPLDTKTDNNNDNDNDNDNKPDSHQNGEITISDHQNNIITVQTRDYEHSYLPGILLSKRNGDDIQQYYFALRAFHIEIASIRSNEKSSDSGSNSLLGGAGGGGNNLALLRMRWWKEALHYLYDNDDNDNGDDNDDDSGKINTKKKKRKASSGNVGSNPTIRSLRHVVQSQGLSRHLFETMIDARMDDLAGSDDNSNSDNLGGGGCGGGGGGSSNDDDLFQSTSVMVDFYSRTISSLLFLHLECCGVKLSFDNNEGGVGSGEGNNNDDRLKEVVNCIGIGIGIINSIRSINTGQTGIPQDLVRKYKISMNDINDPRSIIDGHHDDGKTAIQGAVREMALLAKEYLYHARLHQGVIPGGDARASLLAVVSALRYLERLEKLDFDIFHESLRDVENVESLNGRLWRLGSMFYLWRAWLTGVF